MRLQDQETFFNYMRMTSRMFDYILSRVEPFIKKIKTNWRVPIPAAARLSMTIRTGRSTTSGIIKETCQAIWECFHKEELFTPAQNGWGDIAHEFQQMWNFPICISALDGKHVAIICPQKAGSTYYNYKGFHSIVLLALVSATYKFLIVDIGAQGRHSDRGIFKNSVMGQRFYNNTMNLPDPSAISMRHNVPYVIVTKPFN
ncbi:hypothetical protein ACS0PU_005420 [Formica fusca]